MIDLQRRVCSTVLAEVEALHFSHYTWWDEGADLLLCRALRSCGNLRVLNLYHSSFSNRGVEELTALLLDGCLPQLEYVAVANTMPCH